MTAAIVLVDEDEPCVPRLGLVLVHVVPRLIWLWHG